MKSITTRIALGVLMLGLSACKNPSPNYKFFENLDVKVTTVGTDSFISLVSVFDLGNVSLAEIGANILDPQTKNIVGTVDFSTLPNGQAQITLSVNAALIDHADATLGQTLPNGNTIPLILGATPGTILAVPFMTNSRVYLGGDLKKAVYAGVAVGINGLDQVMNQLSTPANLFLSANFGANILAVGGIYGSSVPAQNGIAVFGKYTANAADLMPINLDTRKDFQGEKLNIKTQRKMSKFFYGKPRIVYPN